MRRALLLAVFGSMLLVGSAGVALAADVFCTGGPCEGTELDDFITGTAQSDQIFALGGFDVVFALAGQDELNGQNGSDALFGENNSDTYFGGGGSDLLSEFESLTEVTNSGARRDERRLERRPLGRQHWRRHPKGPGWRRVLRPY